MSEVIKKEHNQIQAKPRIDSRAEIIDPIDFSFKDLMHLEEINDATPRYTVKQEPKRVDGKYASLGLKLGYNALSEINGLYDWCAFTFAFPDKISSLDLSFNCFSNIPDEVLKFQGLKCLYLHGNKILNLTEVDKLKRLPNLTMLTLHGNPIENLAAFRYYILNKLPALKHLNFSGISKADKQTAAFWTKSINSPLIAETEDSLLQKKSKKKVVDQDD